MPIHSAIQRAKRAAKEGKAPTTQAGEFVREEIHQSREGKSGARTVKQAIAIGLSKARRAGVDLPPPPDAASEDKSPHKESSRRSSATSKSRPEAQNHVASKAALSKQARISAAKRTPEERSASARKATRTRKASGNGNTAHA